jgi:aspartate aminotransferase-like enzyme
MTSTASAPTHAAHGATFGKFFLPGPTDVHPEVLDAMIRPMIGHRSSGMEKLLQNIAPKLGAVARTSRPVFVGTTSATGFMEMAVRNGVRRRALSLVNGAFSERFAGIVGACGKESIRLDVPLGAAVEPDMLRDALKRTPVDAVTCVHSETSTGVLQDVAAYAEVVKDFDDVLLLVDCVTSMCGSPVETDAWKLDFAFTGSQKALALPPGLALGIASDRMVERAKTLDERGAYFDLTAFARKVGEAVVNDVDARVWSYGEIPLVTGAFLESRRAPEFTVPDRKGRPVHLARFRGKKVLVVTWASW